MVYHIVCMPYRLTQIFGRAKPWQIIGRSSNFTVQILTVSCDINRNLPKFSSAKIHTTQYLYFHELYVICSMRQYFYEFR